MKITGTYTSVWDDGRAITTAAVLDNETGELEIEMTTEDVDDLDVLIDEFFDLGGTVHKVCPTCHSHILKEKDITELDEDGNELPEIGGIFICSDPYCESHYMIEYFG